MTPAEHLAPDSIEREAEVELKEGALVVVAAEVQLGVLFHSVLHDFAEVYDLDIFSRSFRQFLFLAGCVVVVAEVDSCWLGE